MNKVEIAVILLVLTVASLIRLPLIAQDFFAFTYDQGRDLLAVKEIVLDKNLTLIGPTTGIAGIFYGPWWYYFLSLVFIISKNPTVITFIFGTIGVTTVLLIYLLVKKITNNVPISIFTALCASFSQIFSAYSSQIWNPSLVPLLMVAYVASLHNILKKPNAKWFFISGLTSGFVLDTEAAFGVILIVSTITLSLFFKKSFFNKKYLMYFFAILFIILPRIIFEIRHDFLMTKAFVSWTEINNSSELFPEKLLSRLDQFFLIFAQTFSKSNKLFAGFPLIFILMSIILLFKKFKQDRLFLFLTVLFTLISVGFIIYPGPIWDYYLVGLPPLFLSIFALSSKYLYVKSPKIVIILLFLIVILNFDKKIFSPFAINWAGDGAIYKNQKIVIESLKTELKGDYSLYVYTPARFDYPFDYLIWWYHQKGEIDLPAEGQKRLYLIIRDDPTHSHIPTGWYGDKLKDNTKLLDKKYFQGDIIVEKHLVND